MEGYTKKTIAGKSTTVDLESELRENKKRHRRRRRYVRVVCIVFGFVLCLFGAWWLLVRSEVFVVTQVVVQGARQIDDEKIIALLTRKIREHGGFLAWLGEKNILAWSGDIAPQELAGEPLIKTLTIKKEYRNHAVVIMVEERLPFGVWCRVPMSDAEENIPDVSLEFHAGSASRQEIEENMPQRIPDDSSLVELHTATVRRDAPGERSGDEECLWFDTEGIIIKTAPFVRGSLIPALYDTNQRNLTIGDLVLSENFFPNLVSIFAVLRDTGVGVAAVLLEDISLQEVRIRTYDGPELYFSLRFRAENAGPVMTSLIEKGEFAMLEYIDFRVQNRAYYKK